MDFIVMGFIFWMWICLDDKLSKIKKKLDDNDNSG